MSKRRSVILVIVGAFFLSLFLPIVEAQMTREEAQRLSNELVQMKRLKEQENQILAEELFKKARALYEERDYHKALSEFKKAEELNPQIKKIGVYIEKTEKKIIQEETSHYSLGVKLYKRGDFEGAFAKLDKVSAENPKFKAAQEYKGKVQAAIEKKEEEVRKSVVVSKEKVTLPKKETTAGLLKKGKSSYKKGDYAQSTLIFKGVLSKEPNNRVAQDWLRVSERAEAVAKVREQKAKLTQETKVTLARREAKEEAMLLDVDKAYVPQKKERGPIVEREEEMGKADIERRKIEEMKKKLSELPDVPAVRFTDTDIRDVLEQFMTMTGVTIVLDERTLKKVGMVSGEEEESELKVTFMTVSPIPLLDLLNIALRATGLGYRVEPTYIWISDKETLSKEELVTRTYQLKYGVRRTRKVELVPYEKRGGPKSGTTGY